MLCCCGALQLAGIFYPQKALPLTCHVRRWTGSPPSTQWYDLLSLFHPWRYSWRFAPPLHRAPLCKELDTEALGRAEPETVLTARATQIDVAQIDTAERMAIMSAPGETCVCL